jgi:hypothetical protein
MAKTSTEPEMNRKWNVTGFLQGTNAYLRGDSFESIWLDGPSQRAGWSYADRKNLSEDQLQGLIPEFEREVENLYEKLYRVREQRSVLICIAALPIGIFAGFRFESIEVITWSFGLPFLPLAYVVGKTLFFNYWAPRVWLYLIEKESRRAR